MTDTILHKIKAYKLDEIERKKALKPASDLWNLIEDTTQRNTFQDAITTKASTHAIIAEIKKASPSKGLIRSSFKPSDIAKEYQMGGACCISVLTDGPSFMGHERDLVAVKQVTTLPVLRKDFIFDKYQILESKIIGADCILLILSALDFSQAKELEEFAHNIGLEVLLEAHDQNEIEITNLLNSPLVGINNRNLHTFETDRSLTKTLSAYLDPKKILVSESGLSKRNHLEELSEYGVSAFLIGESLMRSSDICLELKKLSR